MSALDFPEANADPLDEGRVEAGHYPTAAAAAEHGLVVLALGAPYWLEPDAAGFRLLVEPAVAARVSAHLAAYARESARWPPPPITDPWIPRRIDLITPLLWSALVLVLFQAGGARGWLETAALDSRAVFDRGEAWRLLTALFLHADAGHVISNALSGLLVFSAVVSTFETVRGWLLILAAAILGNFLVAAVNYPTDYVSVGASTAIFAGVGLLTGRAVRIAARSRHPHRWRAMFGPLAAGATVLALYGAGGQRVDVGAHLTGFLAGVMFGFATGLRARIDRLSPG